MPCELWSISTHCTSVSVASIPLSLARFLFRTITFVKSPLQFLHRPSGLSFFQCQRFSPHIQHTSGTGVVLAGSNPLKVCSLIAFSSISSGWIAQTRRYRQQAHDDEDESKQAVLGAFAHSLTALPNTS